MLKCNGQSDLSSVGASKKEILVGLNKEMTIHLQPFWELKALSIKEVAKVRNLF